MTIYEVERVILFWVQVIAPIVLISHPIPGPARNPATLYVEGAEEVLFTVCRVYNGLAVLLVPFCGGLARVNGAPVLNQN